MKKIRLPSPIIMVIGGLAAFWIADIIHPGFNPIGVMILMLIPVLIVELFYPQPELEQLIEQAHYEAVQQQIAAEPETVEEEPEAELEAEAPSS